MCLETPPHLSTISQLLNSPIDLPMQNELENRKKAAFSYNCIHHKQILVFIMSGAMSSERISNEWIAKAS